MKYQKQWYKIFVRGLCVKLLKLKINVRLLAEICLSQTLYSLRVMRMFHSLYKISRFRKVLLEILTDMESEWNTKDGDMKYLFVVVRKVVQNWGKNGWFLLFWAMIWCCFLVLEVCFALRCDFFRWTRFPTFLILFSCPLQWKILFLFHPFGNSKFFDEPRIQS